MVDTLSAPVVTNGGIASPTVVADPAGNVTAVWGQRLPGVTLSVLQAARYSAESRTWGAPRDLSAPSASYGYGQPAVDASGNVTVVWLQVDGTRRTVQVARYDVGLGAWAPTIDLSPLAEAAMCYNLALTPAGDVFVAWRHDGGVRAARFSADEGAWGPAATLSAAPGGGGCPLGVAADPGGDAVIVWGVPDGVGAAVHASRYATALGAWTAPQEIGPGGQPITALSVVRSPGGTFFASWQRFDGIRWKPQAIRFAAGLWGTAVTLPGGIDATGGPVLRSLAGGDALALWIEREFVAACSEGGVLLAARYTAGLPGWQAPRILGKGCQIEFALDVDAMGNAVVALKREASSGAVIDALRYSGPADVWGPLVPLSSGGDAYPPVRVVADGSGNALVVWSRSVPGGGHPLQGARYLAQTGTWTITADVTGPGVSAYNPALAFDGRGNAIAVWNEGDGYSTTPAAIRSTRWLATPGPPRILGMWPGPGTLNLVFQPPTTTEGELRPTACAWSADDGATWSDPVTPSTTMLQITGLTDGMQYRVRLRAINAAGAGTPSAPVQALVGTDAPCTPLNLTATRIIGNTVTLAWTPAWCHMVPTSYRVEGGLAPDETLASLPVLEPPFTFTAPSGVFYVRVVTVEGTARSAPSNEIRIAVNVRAAPSAPTDLHGMVNGSDVALSWTPTFEGGQPTGYALVVLGPVSGTVPLPLGEQFQFTGVPSGVYTFRVVALNAAGPGPPSAPITMAFPGPCSGPPDRPSRMLVTRSGRTIAVSWEPPWSGTAVTGYVLSVSGSYTGAFATTGRELAGTVDPGSYTIRAEAANACGISSGVTPVTVDVP